MSAPVDDKPLMASVPDQAPEAVHEVALVANHANQLNIELAPLTTVLGLAVTVTVGAGVAGVVNGGPKARRFGGDARI